MIAKREIWNYAQSTGVWVGKYRNSHNLLHWHYDCELLYVEKGSIDVFCERRTHTLTVGDALLVDSETMHYMQAREKGTVLIVIVFDYNIVKPYFGETHLASPKLSLKYPIPEMYQTLRTCLLSRTPFSGADAAAEILHLMAEIFRSEPIVERPETDSARSLKRLLEDVNARYGEYTFEGGAAFMNMSDAYFSRFFHASTGITFSQYLNYVRTDNAIRMLKEGGRTVTEVSDLCGFGTVRSFNRVLKSLTGHTPRDLPRDFVLDEKFSYPSEESFNPTLYDCELIESGE